MLLACTRELFLEPNPAPLSVLQGACEPVPLRLSQTKGPTQASELAPQSVNI